MKYKHSFSVIIPVYGCNTCLTELVVRLQQALQDITNDIEIILVNDASPDNSWEVISELCKTNKFVKGINLSRNFGQHYAITAGLEHSKGEWCVVMDCDLQDQPEEIKKLYNGINDEYDIVLAQRKVRKDKFLKRLSSKLFYRVFGFLTDTKLDHTVANFGIYHRKVIDAFLAMKDETRFFPTMIQWVGFKKIYIPVEHNNREAGNSSYSFKQLMKLARNNIIAFSDKPLFLTIKIGFFISAISFLVGIFYLIQYFLGNITELGFTSLIISIWFLSGIIISILGIIGLYLSKVFDKVKNRPQYIVKDKINI